MDPGDVSTIINQWPILLIFVGGMAVAMAWNKLLGGGRKNGHDHTDLRAFIGAGFDDMKGRIGEVRDDLRTHATSDDERFGRIEQHMRWDGRERRTKPGEWKHPE